MQLRADEAPRNWRKNIEKLVLLSRSLSKLFIRPWSKARLHMFKERQGEARQRAVNAELRLEVTYSWENRETRV